MIYLADSCPLTRSILLGFLQEAGFEVLSVQHAKEIIGTLSRTGIATASETSVLVLDLDSTTCGGSNLVQLVRKMPISRHLRILGMTFHRDQHQLTEIKNAGVDGFVFREEISRESFISLVYQISNSKPIAAPERQAPSLPTAEQATPKPLTSEDVDRAVVSVAKGRAIKPVVQEVLRITSNNRSNVNDLVEAIRNDPSLTAKVVGASNTVFYKRTGGEVKNLQDAVTLIGMHHVQELALSLNLANDLYGKGLDPILQLPKLWGHSVATAHIAEWIATSSGKCDSGQAYVLGILHDFGRRIMTWELPQHYHAVLSAPEYTHLPLTERERRVAGIDHAILASRVLERWGCPPYLGRAISLHHSPLAWDKKSTDEIFNLVRVVQIADALAIAFGFEADDTDEISMIPQHWLDELFSSPDTQSRSITESLFERIAILLGRSNYPIEIPAQRRGHVAQIVMPGIRPMELEPLQATLLRGYPQAKIVPTAKINISEPATLVVLDWREMDQTDCITSLSALNSRGDIASWPLLIVGYPIDLKTDSMRIPSRRVIKLSGLITANSILRAVEDLSAANEVTRAHSQQAA